MFERDANSRWHHYFPLKRFFAWAVGEGYLKQNPIDTIVLKPPKAAPIEPYGAEHIGTFLKILEYEWKNTNDISESVHAFWSAVFHQPEELCRLMRNTPVTIEEWKKQRAIQLEPDKYTNLDLAFSTFFLNRTNRSGIISGGVIGGKAQNSKWKLDARFNKQDLIARIERLARYADRVNLYNLDAEVFMSEVLPKLPLSTLVYLDPPYFAKGNDLYEDRYTPKDHATVAGVVTTIRQPWIVSYDDVTQIEELYHDYRKLTYSINYSAQARYSGAEVMFFSPTLVIPSVKNPTHA